MGAETGIKTLNLEKLFRKHVKQYRALLRWGVDKVFQETRIDMLFTDTKQHIDNGNDEKAIALLEELKTQINSLETQYPDQKNEIKKDLYARIDQLETVIGKSHNIDQNSAHKHLQTLEISRVAIQNDDWLEAKRKINLVENEVLTTVISEDLVINETASNENAIIEKANQARKQVTADNKSEVATVSNKPEPSSTTPPVPPEVPQTQSDTEASRSVKTAELEQVQNQQESSTASQIDPEKNTLTSIKGTPLGPVAQSLYAAQHKTMIGKLLKEQDLQKTLHTLDKSTVDNLRIGFIACPGIINTQLSVFSKRPLSLKETGTQILLLRLSISRALSIYLIGIPANISTDFSKLNELMPELSACFVNTHNLSLKCGNLLAEKLAQCSPEKEKLFIKLQESDANEENTLKQNMNDIEFTKLENAESDFIEDAATYLAQFSRFE